jgi:hypothetical protein
LPELALGERNQQVGIIPSKALSPSFVAICFAIAHIFRDLRYISVTLYYRSATPKGASELHLVIQYGMAR